jgi:hypothetical protein
MSQVPVVGPADLSGDDDHSSQENLGRDAG